MKTPKIFKKLALQNGRFDISAKLKKCNFKHSLYLRLQKKKFIFLNVIIKYIKKKKSSRTIAITFDTYVWNTRYIRVCCIKLQFCRSYCITTITLTDAFGVRVCVCVFILFFSVFDVFFVFFFCFFFASVRTGVVVRLVPERNPMAPSHRRSVFRRATTSGSRTACIPRSHTHTREKERGLLIVYVSVALTTVPTRFVATPPPTLTPPRTVLAFGDIPTPSVRMKSRCRRRTVIIIIILISGVVKTRTRRRKAVGTPHANDRNNKTIL